MASNKRFGELLSEGIFSVAKRQRETIAGVEQEIAKELGYTHHTVQRWRRGYLPKDPAQAAFIVRYCVTHGRVGRDWAQSILTQARYPEREALLQELFPERPRRTEVPRVYQNLPPRYGEFLGREADMARVLEGLASRWPLVSIEGLGGVGKTTLAIETARRCLPSTHPPSGVLSLSKGHPTTQRRPEPAEATPRGPSRSLVRPRTCRGSCRGGPPSHITLDPPFEAIVWVSAKDRPEQKRWLSEVLDGVARVLDYPYITQLPREQKPAEVDQLLRAHRTLVIVDNFETIEDSDLVRWMQRVPEPSKVLITSRYAQLRSVWAIHLRGLEEPEALELTRRHARRLGLRTLETATEDELLPLARVTEGNPKAIEMALGYVKYGGLGLGEVVDHLHAASQTVGNIFQDLFARAWEVLTEDARHVLLVVPFFVDTASKEALGAAAGLKGYRLDAALGQLVEMSLLDVDEALAASERRYSAHPLTRAFAGAKLREVPKWEREARERWARWYADFLTQHEQEDWPAFKALDAERENILAVIDWTLKHAHLVAPTLVQRFWYFLYIRGRWPLCEAYARRAIEQTTAQNDTPLRLWLASHLGWLFVEQGRLGEAVKWLHGVEEEIRTLNRLALLAETDALNYLGQVYLAQNDLDRAEAYETSFLELTEQTGELRGALTARYYLGRIQLRRGHMAEVEQHYRDLVAKAQEIGWERAEGYCAYRLAQALIHLGRLEEAEHWLNHANAMADRWKEPQLRAHCFFRRAELLMHRGQISEASQAAQTAHDLYHRVGMHQEETKTAALIERLERILVQEKN